MWAYSLGMVCCLTLVEQRLGCRAVESAIDNQHRARPALLLASTLCNSGAAWQLVPDSMHNH